MTKTHVLLRNRRTVDNEVKHKRTCYKRETILKAKRDRSESPSDYNEPPKLELMPVVEDADENFDYPHVLPNEDHLRPGKTIISCPVESCNIRRFHVIEIISHFRQDHSNDYNSYEPTIQVYNCPLCSTKRFNSATTSSTYPLLQEHAIRYHGRSLNENDFPLFCSIKINSQQDCSSQFNNNNDHVMMKKSNNLNDISIKSDPDAIDECKSSNINASFEKEENASTHSAALTLASLQQIIDESGKNYTTPETRSNTLGVKAIRNTASSLDALSKVAHFNTVINSPSLQREMNNNVKTNGACINSLGSSKDSTDLANINGLHTLAILSMQNQEILEGQKTEEVAMSHLANGQRQILPKLSTNPVKQTTHNKPDLIDPVPTSNKRSYNNKDASMTSPQVNGNGPSRKRPLPPLAMKPSTNSVQSSSGQTLNSTQVINPATPSSIANHKISNNNASTNKLAKMAIPPLSMTQACHPKLILPANMNAQASSSAASASIQSSSAVQTLASKIMFSTPQTSQAKTIGTLNANSKGLINQTSSQKARQQNLQDSINTNNNLTALMLQIQNSPNNARATHLATSTISPNFRNCTKASGMTAIITSTPASATPSASQSSANDDSPMAKNSPIRLMINTSDVCGLTPAPSATTGNNSLSNGNPSPTRPPATDQLKKISPNSFIKRLAIVQTTTNSMNNNGAQLFSTATIKQPAQPPTTGGAQSNQSAPQKQSLKQPSTLLKILPKPPKMHPAATNNALQKKDAFIKMDEENSLVLQDRCNKHKTNNHNLKNITAI